MSLQQKDHDGYVDEEKEEDLFLERRLVRRLDLRVLPIACLMYLAAYLDRSNLGNARTLPQSVETMLGGDPTGVLFDWVNSIFFLSYILCQVPATLLAKLFPPRLYLGMAAIGWGVSSTLMSTGFNFAGLVVCRIFLGVFEAAFGPGIPLYFSLFYTKHEIGLRLAYWFGFAAVAGAFGGLIAFGISHAYASVAQWRLLFIVEGIPAVLLGFVAIAFLPNRPETTSFFNEEERKIALRRRSRGTSGDTGFMINKSHVLDAFTDWKIYLGGVIYFGGNAALSSIAAFLPTILTTLGYSGASSNLMTVPPYAVAAFVISASSWTSDRLQVRGPFVSAWAAVSAIGYLLLLTVADNQHVRYFAVFCIVGGTYTVIGLTIAWFAHNLGSETKRATGTPLYMAIGQGGSVLGAHLLPKGQGPRYIRGFAVLCALMFLASICALALSAYYRWENQRRDRVHGPVSPDAPVDTSVDADRAPTFRYNP
ncbi:MFS general substrate transporter [Vararia minispora EC-137]|uniref:MFS general substrate transporter n=1 Tax=Vararia minispora EC-137 TaxID=1314806 RepID=A0ACB8QW97_9AGAM|nr:MFS general substrate transporter [Vararia minispora EC-137]